MEGVSEYPPKDDKLKKELIDAVRKAIGAIATPDFIHWVGFELGLTELGRQRWFAKVEFVKSRS